MKLTGIFLKEDKKSVFYCHKTEIAIRDFLDGC